MRGRTVAIGLAAVLLFGACGDEEGSASSTTTVAPATTTTLSQIQLDKAKAQRIVLSATDLPGYTQDRPDLGGDSPEFEAAANACVNNNPLIVALGSDTTNLNVSVTTTKLPAINVGDQSVAYRTVARFRTQSTNIVLNVDFTFIQVGRAFGSIQDLQATTAFPDAERLRLATALAGRMAAP